MSKIDLKVSAILGFLIGFFLIFIIPNLNFDIGFSSYFLPFIFLGVAEAGYLGAFFLARLWKTILQFAKFILVGVFNTVLNFFILNIFLTVSSIDSGLWYSVFVAIAFIVAVVNSYFWNKYWVFSAGDEKSSAEEFGKFFFVSLIGFGVSVGIASLLVNVIGAPPLFNTKLWANIGNGAATILTLIWNFTGYKIFVFKKSFFADSAN